MPKTFEPFLTDLETRPCESGILLSARFDEAKLDKLDLPFALPKRLEKAIPKRQSEYFAGRLLCHIGQKAMGLEVQDIGTDGSRAPIWPAGVSGSISHSKGHAVVWITDRRGITLGVDIEGVVGKSALEAIKSSVVTKEEFDLVSGDPVALTAIFSAKETLYKALYPRVRRFFGFKAARAVAFEQGFVTLELTETLTEDFSVGRRFNVTVEYTEPGILTRLCVEGA